jgi:hypothetical protein
MEMSERFDDFMAVYSPEVRALAEKARRLILSVMPSAIEQVDPPSKIIAYGFDRTYAGLVCAIAPHTAHVNLMFSRGAVLPDPAGLLEGTGKRARHVKLKTLADLDNPAVRAFLETAAAWAEQ